MHRVKQALGTCSGNNNYEIPLPILALDLWLYIRYEKVTHYILFKINITPRGSGMHSVLTKCLVNKSQGKYFKNFIHLLVSTLTEIKKPFLYNVKNRFNKRNTDLTCMYVYVSNMSGSKLQLTHTHCNVKSECNKKICRNTFLHIFYFYFLVVNLTSSSVEVP